MRCWWRCWRTRCFNSAEGDGPGPRTSRSAQIVADPKVWRGLELAGRRRGQLVVASAGVHEHIGTGRPVSVAAGAEVVLAHHTHTAPFVDDGADAAGVDQRVVLDGRCSTASLQEDASMLAIVQHVVHDSHRHLADNAISVVVWRYAGHVSNHIAFDIDVWIAALVPVQVDNDRTGCLGLHVRDGVSDDVDVARRSLDVDCLVGCTHDPVVDHDDVADVINAARTARAEVDTFAVRRSLVGSSAGLRPCCLRFARLTSRP